MQQRRVDARRVLSQLVLIAGLVLLWALLWGQFTPLNLLTGIVLAVGVSSVFYLPAVQLSGRVNPLRAVVFLLRLVWDIARASAHIAWMVVKPGYVPSNAIIAVPLLTRSDLMMSWTAEAISIVPGSIVVDQDRERSTLYVHAIDVHNDADLDRVRREILGTERRLLLAIGAPEEAAAARRGIRLTREGDQ